VSKGVTYFYRVSAFNENEESSLSTDVFALTYSIGDILIRVSSQEGLLIKDALVEIKCYSDSDQSGIFAPLGITNDFGIVSAIPDPISNCQDGYTYDFRVSRQGYATVTDISQLNMDKNGNAEYGRFYYFTAQPEVYGLGLPYGLFVSVVDEDGAGIIPDGITYKGEPSLSSKGGNFYYWADTSGVPGYIRIEKEGYKTRIFSVTTVQGKQTQVIYTDSEDYCGNAECEIVYYSGLEVGEGEDQIPVDDNLPVSTSTGGGSVILENNKKDVQEVVQSEQKNEIKENKVEIKKTPISANISTVQTPDKKIPINALESIGEIENFSKEIFNNQTVEINNKALDSTGKQENNRPPVKFIYLIIPILGGGLLSWLYLRFFVK